MIALKPALSAQQEKFTSSGKSRLETYKEYAVGSKGYLSLCYYEFCQLFFASLGGLAGLGLRSLFYPALFGKCGSGVAFGRSLVVRNPGQIQLGSKVLIDDFASLDVRGYESSIEIADYVSIGRFSIIAAKYGSISIAGGANIGTNCRIATNSRVEIGESALVAAYCYIGPGNHRQDDTDTPLIASSMDIKGGVKIGAHSWIGARATILDGVTIGERAIVGAHSLVKDDVPAGATVAGTPARIIHSK